MAGCCRSFPTLEICFTSSPADAKVIRRHVLGETFYDSFLTEAHALANEPDVIFFHAAPPRDCPTSPDDSCASTFEKGQLLVNEKRGGKERLIARWVKGPQLAGRSFGNPLTAGGTAHFDAWLETAS